MDELRRFNDYPVRELGSKLLTTRSALSSERKRMILSVTDRNIGGIILYPGKLLRYLFNIQQNLPKEKGLREAYVPDDGKAFLSVDYGQEELVTLAYELKARYGKSRMYDAVQKGLDLHTFFSLYRAHEIDDLDLDTLDEDACAAIKERGKKYKETKEGKRSRQLSKCCNFGKRTNAEVKDRN